LESGWVVQGPLVKQFEELWSEFTGAEHSIAVTSCTTALHLSLFALGIGPGDEVILPAFTWIATANVVEHLGGKVVFCDIDLETFNIDYHQIEGLITPNTKAIVPVHLFGLSIEMDHILELAKKHNLFVVEDAACGFGAKYKGQHVGNFGNTGCFSFHPRKAITTGEGGMITVNDSDLAHRMRTLRDHGASMSDIQRHYGAKPFLLPDFAFAGFNYRMTDIQASIGVTQMRRATEILRARQRIAKKYDELLSNLNWLAVPRTPHGLSHGYQSYVCLFRGEEINTHNFKEIHAQRNELMEYLQIRGISTRPGTHSVPDLDYYRTKYSLAPQSCINAWMADQSSIALPIFPALKYQEIDYIHKSLASYKIKI